MAPAVIIALMQWGRQQTPNRPLPLAPNGNTRGSTGPCPQEQTPKEQSQGEWPHGVRALCALSPESTLQTTLSEKSDANYKRLSTQKILQISRSHRSPSGRPSLSALCTQTQCHKTHAGPNSAPLGQDTRPAPVRRALLPPSKRYHRVIVLRQDCASASCGGVLCSWASAACCKGVTLGP